MFTKMRGSAFVCCLLLIAAFVLATSAAVLAAGPDDVANYGMRAIRITNGCDPQIPPPAVAGSCATVTPGSWSFDISWFDAATQKYYLADRSNKAIDIVDTRTDKVAGEAAGLAGPNGVLVTHHPHQLWIGDAGSNVVVFALDKNGMPSSSLPIATVPTGGTGRADELAYDPRDHLILVANDEPADLFITFISVSSNPSNIKVVGSISFNAATNPNVLGGTSTDGIEQSVYDRGLDRFLLAVPATTGHTNGEIAVINPDTMQLEDVYGVDGTGCFPHGLALGPHQNLLLGCSADGPAGTPLVSLLMDATSGRILKTFTQVGGSDEVWYNPGDNHYYLAASNFTKDGTVGGASNGVLGIIDAGSRHEAAHWIQNVPTGAHNHSVAAVFSFRGDRGDMDHRDRGRRDSERGNFTRNRIYVPLRVNTASGETGGIGVYGRIP